GGRAVRHRRARAGPPAPERRAGRRRRGAAAGAALRLSGRTRRGRAGGVLCARADAGPVRSYRHPPAADPGDQGRVPPDAGGDGAGRRDRAGGRDRRRRRAGPAGRRLRRRPHRGPRPPHPHPRRPARRTPVALVGRPRASRTVVGAALACSAPPPSPSLGWAAFVRPALLSRSLAGPPSRIPRSRRAVLARSSLARGCPRTLRARAVLAGALARSAPPPPCRGGAVLLL